jgi:hypothetical protein
MDQRRAALISVGRHELERRMVPGDLDRVIRVHTVQHPPEAGTEPHAVGERPEDIAVDRIRSARSNLDGPDVAAGTADGDGRPTGGSQVAARLPML